MAMTTPAPAEHEHGHPNIVLATLALANVMSAKLAILYDLERIADLLRDGSEPFDPERDRLAFVRYLIDIGSQPPPR